MFDFTLTTSPDSQTLPALFGQPITLNAPMPDLTDKRSWQKHTMSRLYDLSLADDPKIALSALEKIAKTSVADLMTPTVTINYQSKTTEELQQELVKRVEKIIEGEAIRV